MMAVCKTSTLPARLLVICILALFTLSSVNAASDFRKPLPETVKKRHQQLLLWLQQHPLIDPAPAAVIEPILNTPPATPLPSPAYPPQLVIVIDDLGNNLPNGERAVQLPGKVSMAFLPFTPHTQKLAQAAHEQGKEILLHAPMDNHKHLPLGPGALTLNMSQQEFANQLRQSIDDVPYLSGINNHMGSLLTEQSRQMSWTMQVLKERQLFFLDSRTSAHSVAAQTAREFGVPNLSRSVFLDHVNEPEAIATAFDRAIDIARKYGAAVVIGHPNPHTLDLLEQRLPALQQLGIEQTTVSQLIGQQRLAELQP